MFKEERVQPTFCWEQLGDLETGRPNLGRDTDIVVYRLMQFTLRDVLIAKLGVAEADAVFYAAGESAGRHFHRNLIREKSDFEAFLAELARTLTALKIGIVRVEAVAPDRTCMTLTVAEDLDCSGLPACGEQICTYDEGFLAGLFSEQTEKAWRVKEVDCWCSGDRVCRFEARQEA